MNFQGHKGTTYRQELYLQLEEERRDMTGKNGVLLGLFFSKANFAPVINGKLIDRDKLYGLVVNDGRGLSVVNCMLLSVRKISDEDYRLYGFGKPTKPLIDIKFSRGKGPGAEPVALEIKEGNPVEFEITVFDKQATHGLRRGLRAVAAPRLSQIMGKDKPVGPGFGSPRKAGRG